MKSKTENTDNSLYLKEAHLKGYKSIKDVRIDFKKGLNIIIGKNAAGKTNFLTFLSKTFTNSYEKLINFYSVLTFKHKKGVSIFQEKKINRDAFSKKLFEKAVVSTKIKNDNTYIHNVKDVDVTLTELSVIYNSTFIQHGVPANYYFVNSPFAFSYDKEGVSVELMGLANNIFTPYLLKNLFTIISDYIFFGNSDTKEKVKQIIEKSVEDTIRKIKSYIVKYSPIQDFGLNKDFNIHIGKDNKGITVSNLFLEFKVEDNWYPFINLSDGTKRLFYVISEVAFVGRIDFRNFGSIAFNNDNVKRIILLEEPELGIHPHQLHNLMLFLKEMSRDRQIIISTHSPQVLNILEKDELDRIIIASSEGKEGTKMRHLSDEEILKAQKYMEDIYLGDYWMHSDLEKE